MNRKILVTGANGQLGSELKALSANPEIQHSFIFTDIDTLDLTNKSDTLAFLHKANPDLILNCAAYTAVDKAESDAKMAELLNAGIPATLKDFSDVSGARIIHISTDYVFPGDKPSPLKESDETGPKSEYGRSKLKGEKILIESKNSMIIRTSWLHSSFGKNFVKSMLSLMKERRELRVVYDQTGSPTYAEDLASAILKIASIDGPWPNGIYHYSNEGVTSWFDLTCEIKNYTGSACKIIPIETKDYPLPATRPAYAVLNKEKIKRQFDLDIPHWKSGLIRCLDKIIQ